jgi:hypothetical protein
MRMTDETPRVNHSFDARVANFFSRQNRALARQSAERGIGQRGGV